MAAVNVTKSQDDAATLRVMLRLLGHRNVHDLLKHVWLTSVSTAADVSGTDLDDDLQAGDLILNKTTETELFVCTVAPSSNDGTFVKLIA